MDKSKIVPYEFAYFSMVKNIYKYSKKYWRQLKNFEHGQNIFEPADETGKSPILFRRPLILESRIMQSEQYCN